MVYYILDNYAIITSEEKMQQFIAKIFKSSDKYLLCISSLLSVFGMIVISSATYSMGNVKFVIVQLAAYLIGFVCMAALTVIDFESFGNKTGFIYAFNILLLTVVLFLGTGDEVGTRGWRRFGPVGIQPAEIVKIGYILTLAKHVSRNERHINSLFPFMGLAFHAAVIIGMVLLQPDYGTAMVYMFIFICMIFASGLYYRAILAAIAAFAAFMPVAWFFILQPFQKNRILTFINPELDPSGAGYHVIQSKIAIGSGGLFGRGLYNGPQTQLEILPEKHTDFIFAVIGEELGFIACIAVIALLFALVIRCFVIASKCRSKYGKYICIGVGAMILFQTFENVGMCIGVMPVTGIPLPFISYGGSSMITNMIGMGLVMSVAARQQTINFR